MLLCYRKYPPARHIFFREVRTGLGSTPNINHIRPAQVGSLGQCGANCPKSCAPKIELKQISADAVGNWFQNPVWTRSLSGTMSSVLIWAQWQVQMELRPCTWHSFLGVVYIYIHIYPMDSSDWLHINSNNKYMVFSFQVCMSRVSSLYPVCRGHDSLWVCKWQSSLW